MSPDVPTIVEMLQIVTKKKIDPSSVNESTSYLDDLGMTSIQFVELAMALEDRYDFEMEDVDLGRIRTVGQTIDYVKAKTQGS